MSNIENDLNFFRDIDVPEDEPSSEMVKVTIYVPKSLMGGEDLVAVARNNGHKVAKYLSKVTGLAMAAKKDLWSKKRKAG
jgi:hypothetical protein